jgi:plasmid stabilization system protein ParE
MSFTVEFAPSARDDLLRLYEYLLERAQTVEDLNLAERALRAIETTIDVHLSKTPFIYRKVVPGNGLRRELIVPFGASGYIVLYEIAGPAKVVILAVRHQREEDYH